MTVASAANKVTLNGNGATTSWPFSFRIFDSSDLEIYKTDTSGVQTEITSNFSVVVNGESGGTVTYPSTGSPLASGETITIIRVTVRAQSAVSMQTREEPSGLVPHGHGLFPQVPRKLENSIVTCPRVLSGRSPVRIAPATVWCTRHRTGIVAVALVGGL